uniref:Fibronectin type-III domain-containing protein n=1 Tax=Amphimedon queenslandica TaxID=400682 RepID=A0A1X7SIK0_AMPQE
MGDLIIGTTYSFIIIIPIDTNGREGPPSLIQYIWNEFYYATSSYTNYYIVNVINTTDEQQTPNTNITIAGLPLTDTNYTVTIIPVNVIGYGPSATVNVHNKSLDCSSLASSPGPSS